MHCVSISRLLQLQCALQPTNVLCHQMKNTFSLATVGQCLIIKKQNLQYSTCTKLDKIPRAQFCQHTAVYQNNHGCSVTLVEATS